MDGVEGGMSGPEVGETRKSKTLDGIREIKRLKEVILLYLSTLRLKFFILRRCTLIYL